MNDDYLDQVLRLIDDKGFSLQAEGNLRGDYERFQGNLGALRSLEQRGDLEILATRRESQTGERHVAAVMVRITEQGRELLTELNVRREEQTR